MITKNESSSLGAQKLNEGQLPWYKMPSNLLCDERVERLLAEIGAAGFGVYMYIIAEMMRHRNHCMTRDSLLSIKIKGHTKATLMRIVDDYGLFINDGKGHVYSAVDFLCKSSRNAQKEQQVECPNEQRDNAQNELPDDPQDANLFATGCKSDSIPTPPRALQRREEENKKEITSPKNLLMMVKSCLAKNTAWAESVMMKSRVAMLLAKHWDYAVEIFVQHVISQAKEDSLMDESNARRYFSNFCTGGHTGTVLAARLSEYDRSHPELNPYRFEDADSAPGHRSYLGFPLPDDAPPRPSDTAEWVDGEWGDPLGDFYNNTTFKINTNL